MESQPLIPNSQRPTSNFQLALCLFALLFGVYLLTFSGRYHSSDEISMLAATDSLARRGAWDVELIHWMGEQQASFGPDGLLYSRKGIGTTLAALPLYWLAVQVQRIGNVQAAMLTNGVLTALTGVLVLLFLRRLRYTRGIALGSALAFGLGTMAWPYARYLFSESLAGLGLMASAYFLLRYRDEGDWVSVLLAGAGLAVALLARLNNAIVAPFLGLLLLVYLRARISPPGGEGAGGPPPRKQSAAGGTEGGRQLRPSLQPSGEGERSARPPVSPLTSGQVSPPLGAGGAVRVVVLFALPVLAALAITGWYNWLRFGSPLTTGYLPEEQFSTPFFQGFYGLTFSPGKGLFWYNPLFFAALAAWPLFFRRHRAEALLVAAVVLSNVAFYASWYLWWAGHAWGPRFLVTILPFATLPLAAALEVASRRRAVALGVGALAVASVAVQVLGVAVDFSLYLEDVYARLGLYHPATLFEPAYSPLLRQWAYLRPGNLDLAWAQKLAAGSQQQGGQALMLSLGLVLLAGLALWAAWRRRLRKALAAGLVVVLAAGAILLLFFYAPAGDVAEAAGVLARMERPGEAAALTDELLTEAWQNAYDGRLWVWGTREIDPAFETGSLWTIGAGDAEPAVARFQVGRVRLDYFPAESRPFDAGRLPLSPLPDAMQLGRAVQLVAVRIDSTAVQPGSPLSLTLVWRAVASPERSYTVFVQILDESAAKAGQVDRLPCDGGCPTITWRPGDLVAEWYEIPIRADAPPGRYQLVVGMYDLQSGETLATQDGRPYLTLGTVQIEP